MGFSVITKNRIENIKSGEGSEEVAEYRKTHTRVLISITGRESRREGGREGDTDTDTRTRTYFDDSKCSFFQ